MDQLGLTDSPEVAVKLQELLLDNCPDSEVSLRQLSEFLKKRVEDGHGESIFDLGEDENGHAMGFTLEDWNLALRRVTEAAQQFDATCRVLLTYNVGGAEESEMPNEPKHACHGKVLIRQRPKSVEDIIETRIAVVGNVDAGKSTLLGVLVRGNLDDGRGRARITLFRHKHEVQSGRTSSVGLEILGFNSQGAIIGYGHHKKLSWTEIGEKASKIISFTDLAGHERYLRTTVFGMLSSSPSYCLLMVAANNGLIGMSKEHLGIALSLNIPVMVIITKVDICPPQILQETITQLKRLLKSPGARKVPVFVDSREHCVNTATQFVNQRICPIFQISNVTGQSLDLVRLFLDILPHHGKFENDAPCKFLVSDTFSVPFVGTVVSGILQTGVIQSNDEVVIGPDSNGNFKTTAIKSIERNRSSVPITFAGQHVALALKNVRRKDVRKGMIIFPKTDQLPVVYRRFVAEVLILSHPTTIKPKYEAMLHVGAVQQTCRIVGLDREHIRTGDRALVGLEFAIRPEFVAPGDRIIFREGRTKALGIVKEVGDETYKNLQVVVPETANRKKIWNAPKK